MLPSVRRCLVVSLALVLLVLARPLLVAQTFRGGINGTVSDASGAAITGAAVTATNVDTKAVSSSATTSNGDFLFQDLPLGTYSVLVSATGFDSTKTDKITVSAGVIYTLPVRLVVSSAGTNTVIQVDAAAITLDTTTATQTTVLSPAEVANLPLNGRDFTQMVQLTPGYAGYSGGGGGSLNGTRSNQMNWQIDGVDNNDLWHNIPAVNQGGVSGIAGILLPLDAVDQFSAQTQSAPEGGRNPGGTINLTLRSGTNALHGTAYYFNRNELFGAKNPFDTTVGNKQKVRNYNTGFSVGGPFLRDKLFGFLTFEHQRFIIGQSQNATEPSVGWQAKATQILAAQGLTPLPIMQRTLNTLWGANVLSQDQVGVVNNYHSTDPEFGYSWDGLAKVDWRLSAKDNLSVHWFVGQGNQVAPAGSQLLNYYQVAPAHVQNIAIVYNRVLTPNITNQVLAGVNYFNQVFNDNDTNFNVQSIGFVTGATFTNSPNITIGDFDPVGVTPPLGRNDITGHLTDQLSWVKGAHQMRFGGEYRQAQLDEFYHRKATGAFTFDGTQVGGSGDTYAAALADFLAGRTSSASITVGDPERQVFVNTFFLNAGDSWQASKKLNINYGVRYDYTGPLHNSNKDMSVFRPALTATNGLAIQGQNLDNLFQPYWTAISPRLGLSFAPDEKTVFRAGYGWYFDSPNLNPFLDNRPGNQAPNGVEGNPTANNPVATVSANGGKTQIVDGVPIFPTTVNIVQQCQPTSPCGIFSVNSNFRPSYNENFSFNLERTLAPNVILQLGYVGSQGRHLLSLLDINQVAPGTYASSLALQQARPFFSQYPNYGNINQIESIGTSNYNSLQAQLRVQAFHGLSMQSIYTWSHNLDVVTAFRGALPQDSRNFKGDYSNSDFDTRNTFVNYVSYAVPGSSHGPHALSNGWIVNSLISLHGGQPFNVLASGDISGTNEGNDRAILVGNPHKGFQGQKPNASWLDPAAFSNPAAGTFSPLRRNSFYGPGFADVDLSVFKDTHITEHATVELRAEMFNLLNRNNFAPPSSTSAGGSFTLNSTVGGNYGAPGIGAGEPFNTQFGAKVIF